MTHPALPHLHSAANSLALARADLLSTGDHARAAVVSDAAADMVALLREIKRPVIEANCVEVGP